MTQASSFGRRQPPDRYQTTTPLQPCGGASSTSCRKGAASNPEPATPSQRPGAGPLRRPRGAQRRLLHSARAADRTPDAERRRERFDRVAAQSPSGIKCRLRPPRRRVFSLRCGPRRGAMTPPARSIRAARDPAPIRGISGPAGVCPLVGGDVALLPGLVIASRNELMHGLVAGWRGER